MGVYALWIFGVLSFISCAYFWYELNAIAKRYGCILISTGLFKPYLCEKSRHKKRFIFFLIWFNVLHVLGCAFSLYFPIWIQSPYLIGG